MNGEIVVPCPNDGKSPTALFDEMCRRRQEFLAAWSAWVAVNPFRDQVELERDGTCRAVASLATLLARP